MKNSNSFSILSTKSLKVNRKIKLIKSHKLYPQFTSMKMIFPKSNSDINMLLERQSFTTIAKNNDINMKNIFNKNTPTFYQNVKKKFRNLYIFGKRELAYNKSMQEGRKVFKYNQSIELVKSSKKKKRAFNTIYLTESLTKSTKNQTSLPLLEKDKSLNEENITSLLNNTKNISFTRNSFINISSNIINNKNNLANNVKNKDDFVLLKKINLNETNDKEYIKHISLIKKQKILKRSINKDQTINNYIKDVRNVILDKYNLNIKKEKIKIIEENLNNKINKLNNDMKEYELNSDFFRQDLLPKLNEYYKFILNQKDVEKQKNLLYINKIYLLKKHILFIKSKINKRQIEKQFLMREIFLLISIHEKKLTLPNYYKDILLNDYSYEQINEKYGGEIDKEEYNRVSNYMASLNESGMEVIFDNLNRLTNNNTELLNEYNKIQEKNLNYKKIKYKVESEFNSDAQKEKKNLIIEKEKTLDIILKTYKNTRKRYVDLKNNISYKNNLGKKRSILFIKLESFLKMLEDDLQYEINIDDKIKGKITEEILMMNMLKKIEIIIQRFLSVYKEIKHDFADKIKSLKNSFEREKKFRKANEQQRNIALKLEIERKRIFDRYNKILFLPKKKIHYKKPNKKISFEEDLTKNEENSNRIEDFLDY